MNTFAEHKEALAMALARRAATLSAECINGSRYGDDATYQYTLHNKGNEVLHTEDVHYKSSQAISDGEQLTNVRYGDKDKRGGQALSVAARLLKKLQTIPEDAGAAASIEAAEAAALRAESASSVVFALVDGQSASQVRWAAKGAGITVPDMLTDDAIAELFASLASAYPDALVARKGTRTERVYDLDTIFQSRRACTANLVGIADAAEAKLAEAMERIKRLKEEAERARSAVDSLTVVKARIW